MIRTHNQPRAKRWSTSRTTGNRWTEGRKKLNLGSDLLHSGCPTPASCRIPFVATLSCCVIHRLSSSHPYRLQNSMKKTRAQSQYDRVSCFLSSFLKRIFPCSFSADEMMGEKRSQCTGHTILARLAGGHCSRSSDEYSTGNVRCEVELLPRNNVGRIRSNQQARDRVDAGWGGARYRCLILDSPSGV